MPSWILAFVFALAAAPQLGVNALISQLEAPDSAAVTAAIDMLKARGPEVLPALIKALHDNQSCQVQVQASAIVRDLQPDSPAPTAALLNVLQSKCKANVQSMPLFRRQAAFALATHADGVAPLLGFLKDGDAGRRRTAAGGFQDAMMGLQIATTKIDMTPALIDAQKTAFAALVIALKDSDETVRCNAYSALTEAQKTSTAALKTEAARVLEGVTPPKCPAK